MVNIIKTTKNSTTGIDIAWQLEIMNGSKKQILCNEISNCECNVTT